VPTNDVRPELVNLTTGIVRTFGAAIPDENGSKPARLGAITNKATAAPSFSPYRGANPLASSRHLHQQPQDLEVQPDQGYHQGETRVPLRPFWCSILDALLDELEIQDQI